MWCVCVCLCKYKSSSTTTNKKKWKKNKQISDTWNNMTILVGRVIIIISHFHSFRFFPFFLVTSRSSSSSSFHQKKKILAFFVSCCCCYSSSMHMCDFRCEIYVQKKKSYFYLLFFRPFINTII